MAKLFGTDDPKPVWSDIDEPAEIAVDEHNRAA
jgi:hypothetical protein